jgi:hypothetical protein
MFEAEPLNEAAPSHAPVMTPGEWWKVLRLLVHRCTMGALSIHSEAFMPSTRHFVEWHGERYTVEPLTGPSPAMPLSPEVWAVSRRGEFIGTIPYGPQETKEEFEHRCARWIADLVGL